MLKIKMGKSIFQDNNDEKSILSLIYMCENVYYNVLNYIITVYKCTEISQ